MAKNNNNLKYSYSWNTTKGRKKETKGSIKSWENNMVQETENKTEYFSYFFSSSLTPFSFSICFYLCFEVLQGVLRNLFVVVGVWVKLLGEGVGWKQQGKLNFRYYFSILLCTIYRHLHTYLSKYWTCCQGKWGVTMNVCCQPTNKYKFTHSNTTTFGRRRDTSLTNRNSAGI